MDRWRTGLEKFADIATQMVGSNAFLLLDIAVFAVWIFLNLSLIPGLKPFDPFPFSFLTSAVSLEAIILAILVLISQNRASHIADLREEIHLQVNVIAEEEITKVMSLLVLIAEKHGLDLSRDIELRSMLTPTNPEKIEKAIERQMA
jgi:uncharacterized membrane protein